MKIKGTPLVNTTTFEGVPINNYVVPKVDRADVVAAFDAIITDIIMPEMDGIQAIMEIQTLQPNARIIAISGGSARMQKAQGLETARRLGAVAVLEKPFEVDTLLSAVDAALA